jgi:hypothetical protein
MKILLLVFTTPTPQFLIVPKPIVPIHVERYLAATNPVQSRPWRHRNKRKKE